MKTLNFLEKIRIRLKNRYSIFVTNCFGFSFTVVDKSSFLYMYDEIFVKEIYKFFSQKNSPKILDCGANIGVSLVYFKKLYPEAHIIAFEPDPVIFEVLDKNVKSGNFNNVELVNKGLSDKEESLSFFSEGSDGGRIAIPSDRKKIVKIDTVKLSPFLNDEIDFLKIDIEGSEFKVLSECQEKLVNIKNIFIEYHSFDNAPQNLGEILSILKMSGFRYYIKSVGVESANPFIKIDTYLNYDLQLNIFAYKV